MTKNAKTVYTILLEFLNYPKINALPRKYYTAYDEYYDTILQIIVEVLIFHAKEDPVKIFDAVCDLDVTNGGDLDLKVYRKILKKEKKRGFKNLALALHERKQSSFKKIKTL